MRRALLFTCALTLAACDSPAPPPRPTPPPPPAPKPAEVVEAPKDAAPAFVYTYNPSARRDPFHSPIDDLNNPTDKGLPIETVKCNQPLCKWDLDQLRLVGIITGMSNPVAMVEDPTGIGHMVRRNTFMGKKGGRVTQIKRDEVTVTEIYRGSDNKPHATLIPLHLVVDANANDAVDLLEPESNE